MASDSEAISPVGTRSLPDAAAIAYGRLMQKVRGLSPQQQQRLVLGSATAAVIYLLVAWMTSAKTVVEPSMCPCQAGTTAKAVLQQFIESAPRLDMEIALSSNASLGPLQRVHWRNSQNILQQRDEIKKLREAARAQDLRVSPKAAAAHVYNTFRIEEDQPSLWKQRTFRKRAKYGFVAFSSYRLTPRRIVTTGIGHFRSRGRMVEKCVWVQDNGREFEGQLNLTTMEEHHEYMYEFVSLTCDLPSSADTSSERDVAVGDSSAKMLVSEQGGFLKVKLELEEFHPYREIAGYKVYPEDSKGPFLFNHLYCGPPMYGDLAVPSVTQFIAYHRFHVGIDHFMLYDSGSVDGWSVLKPLIADGIVTLVDYKEGHQYDTWTMNQALAMHDCLYRSRDLARWIFFHDLDEYLEIPPPSTIQSILQQHKDKRYISHGCMRYSMDNCEETDVWSPQHKKFAVELLLTRSHTPYCTWPEGFPDRNMCLDFHGHRKMIQNPRKIPRTKIHVPEPRDGGVELPITEMRHAHFRSLFVTTRACRGDKRTGEEWKRVTSLADIAAQARECEKELFVPEMCTLQQTKPKRDKD